MTLDDSVVRSWGTETLALRAERRGRRRGWLTTPQQLLAKARQLDQQAISSLYSLYWQPLVSFLRQRGAGPLAEDVAQGFFTRAWHRGYFAKFEPVGSFGAWLRCGVLSHLYGQRKQARTCKRRLEDPQAEEIRRQWEDGQAPAPDLIVDRERKARLMRKAWTRLRAKYQRRGRELRFEYLSRALLREGGDGETKHAVLWEQLGISANHLAQLRHRLFAEELPAELKRLVSEERRSRQEAGALSPRPLLTVDEEVRALLDDV